MMMISVFICLNFMVLPNALHSFTISDVSFINVGRGSIIPSHSNPSFQSASFQTASSKNVDAQQREESSKRAAYDRCGMNVEAGSITPNQEEPIPIKSKSLNPSFPTPSSLPSSFINDCVFSVYGDDMIKSVVFWLLAVLSMNYIVRTDKVMTNILTLFMVITFMTDVGAEGQITKLSVSGSENFGSSVSNYGETVIIGALHRPNKTAYIFSMSSTTKNEWTQISKLTPSDDSTFDAFGSAVSIYDEFAVVGAYGDDNYKGAIYVYQRQENGSWTEQSKLLASDSQNSAGFGYDVSIYDKVMIVSAYADDGSHANEGSVYIFGFSENSNQWIEYQKLKANVTSKNSYFGHSVAVYNNTVIISADEEWYIFEPGMDGFWNQTHHEIGEIGSWWLDVDIYGNTAVIGDTVYERAYIYTKENGVWSNAQTLTANDSTKETGFGDSVSIYDDIVIIGASFDYVNGYGVYYIFRKQSNDLWIESTQIVVYDEGDDFSGVSTSIYNDIIVYGASQVDSSRGAAYIVKNWDSCYSVWNETENKEILFNGTNTSYLIDYEWSLCNFAEFTMSPSISPIPAPTTISINTAPDRNINVNNS